MLTLPQDGHVHSQWSWDAPRGDMERTCAKALELGLKSLVFTDHLDLTPWALHGVEMPDGLRAHARGGMMIPEPLDVTGYLECIQRCRELFPDLLVLSGVEVSEPHLHQDDVKVLLSTGAFDRVLGSVHSLVDLEAAFESPDGASVAGVRVEIASTYAQRPALDVVRNYLGEVATMAESSAPFSVLAHIDYPVRSWPPSAAPFHPVLLEEEYRHALGALAASGRALEVNTRLHFPAEVVKWWHQMGGQAVAFGSDAHQPDVVAREFSDAAAMVAAHGFRPGGTTSGMWPRA
jgi:histidinol-phosphatase (PHP family)